MLGLPPQKQVLITSTAAGRLDEIGPLAVYLASSASDFMTGQTIFLDGGHSVA